MLAPNEQTLALHLVAPSRPHSNPLQPASPIPDPVLLQLLPRHSLGSERRAPDVVHSSSLRLGDGGGGAREEKELEGGGLLDFAVTTVKQIKGPKGRSWISIEVGAARGREAKRKKGDETNSDAPFVVNADAEIQEGCTPSVGMA